MCVRVRSASECHLLDLVVRTEKELPKSCNALSMGERQAVANTHSDEFQLRARDCLDVLGPSLDARDVPMRMSSKASTVLADNVANCTSDQDYPRCLEEMLGCAWDAENRRSARWGSRLSASQLHGFKGKANSR